METEELMQQYNEFLEGYKAKLSSDMTQERNYLEVDFDELSKFNPSLGKDLLDNPEENIKTMKIVAMNIADNDNIKNLQILIHNLPEAQNISLNDISDQLGQFLTFEGYVMKPTEKYLKCRSARFECPSCGNIINVLMLGVDWKEPQRCGCGRKGKFHMLSREFIKFQRLELLEPMDDVPDKPRRPVKKKVFLAENLTRKKINERLQPGQRVKIHGFLELEEIRSKFNKVRSNEFKTNILANNIIPIETSWEAIKLTSNQKKKIKDMAEKESLLDEFAQSLAPAFEGYEMVRKSLILQHVGGKRIFDKNGNLEEREIILVLLSGAPGSGKSYLMKKSLAISPLKNWTTGKGLSGVGLVACVVRDEYGGYTLEVGPLVLADKGMVGIDEMEKINKTDYGMLNNAMAEEKTKITKATVDQELRTRTSILATSNPIHKEFTDRDSIISQMAPIPRDILDRFDCKWAMREDIWSNKEMRNYIAYAKKLTPILNSDIAKYFNEKFRKLTSKTVKNVKKDEDESDEEKSRSHRLRGNIMRWVYAHSKFIGIGKEDKNNKIDVTKESINFAFSLMRHCFTLLNLINKEGFAKYEDIEEIPGKKEVNKYYIVKDAIKKLSPEFKNVIPEENILEEIKKALPDFEMDDVDKQIQKLKGSGEIFEPKPRNWALI